MTWFCRTDVFCTPLSLPCKYFCLTLFFRCVNPTSLVSYGNVTSFCPGFTAQAGLGGASGTRTAWMFFLFLTINTLRFASMFCWFACVPVNLLPPVSVIAHDTTTCTHAEHTDAPFNSSSHVTAQQRTSLWKKSKKKRSVSFTFGNVSTQTPVVSRGRQRG